MNEQQIQEELKQRVPVPPPPPVPVATPPDTSYGQATTAPPFELDEMTQYKMHDYFGEIYHDTDETKRQQVTFIYEHIAQLVDSREYGFVISKARDLERIIGIAEAPDRLYRLYQWLRLDSARKLIDAEMGALTNG